MLADDFVPVASGDRADLDAPAPRVHLLDNGRLVSMVTTAGGGYVQFDDRALTRWRPDATRDADGYYLYLRDLDDGAFWSAGFQPTAVEPTAYHVELAPGLLRIVRRDREIETTLEICVAPDLPVELRRCTVENQSDRPRRIELTSYAEWVLTPAAADAAHPAFSKLFVETSWDADRGLILARRRPRSSTEPPFAAGCFLAGGDRADSFETDRYRFLGRSGTPRRPAALATSQPLSGTTGPVLDPIASLRLTLNLAPQESRTVTFAIGAGANEDDVRKAADAFQDPASIDETFVAAGHAAVQQLLDHGLSPDDLGGVLELAAGRLYAGPLPGGSEGRAVNLQRAEAYLIDRGVPPESSAAESGSPAKITAVEEPSEQLAERAADRAHGSQSDAPAPQFDDCTLANGYGGFSEDGAEYVMRIRPAAGEHSNLPPLPWTNVVSNAEVGFIVSERGAGCTWAGNSRENLLTPWRNDPVSDPHSEALYLRDEDADVFWSPFPGPAPADAEYEVRHGFGYTSFRHQSHDLEQTVIQFVPFDDPIKFTRIQIRNNGDRRRRISLFAYQQWLLGSRSPHESRQIQSRADEQVNLLLATNSLRTMFADSVAASALVALQAAGSVRFTADRTEFLGRHGDLEAPRALREKTALSGAEGSGLDPCAAWQVAWELAPGESVEATVLLGQFDSEDTAWDTFHYFDDADKVEEVLTDAKEMWKRRLSAVEIETPCPAIDAVVNGWLPYQNLSCRIWGRSSFYQGGGAYGFRDQLQDAAAYIYHLPQLTREQIIRHASHQFVEGDVMHWWHTPDSRGIRTRFSDDLIWLPLFAAEYVATTGDTSLWDEQARFLTSPPVPDGEPEIFLHPEDSGETGDIYEHCCRSLDRSLTAGRNGLPLMGSGDWNDGMNRIGIGGQGESVWLGFFLDMALQGMLPICQERKDSQRVEKYSAYSERLREALNDAGWDGGWYRRAYFDDGTPVGTAGADECRIDALVQAWSVLSGIAPPERAEQAIAAVDEQLVNPEAGIIHLLYPPFDKMERDPGYIKGYLPGVRENGGQYTHGVLWYIRAVAQMGRGTRAVELLEMLSPATRAATRAAADRYKTEPYVVAADVYGVPPHAGRGGWSWYTGSAGWMWRVAVESIMGLGMEGGKNLVINPSISREWPECRLRYRVPAFKTVYDITIQNPHGKEHGVTAAEVDGSSCEIRDGKAIVPIMRDDQEHRVVIKL